MPKEKSKLIVVSGLFLLVFGLLVVLSQEKAGETTAAGAEPLPESQEGQEGQAIAIDTEITAGAPVVQYIIDAQLFPDKNSLEGNLILTWVNKTSIPTSTLMFHLYYNAFNGPWTTYLTDKEFYRYTRQQLEQIRFGGIVIDKLEVIGGEDLTGRMEFVSPDDDNPQDKTVLQVVLDKPVEALHQISLKMHFSLVIPGIIRRTGQAGDYFFISQWFPKLGVWQETGDNGRGEWHCHQYHRFGEFFADFGTYKVSLTVPAKFIVGACGSLVKSEKHANGTVTYFYEQENIHDFAWTAYPRFSRSEEKIKLPGNSRETTVELLLSPHHGEVKDRYLDILKFTMDFYARHIFPYPYEKMTLVDPPFIGFLSSGMEYPTLSTAGYIPILPAPFNSIEFITCHEFSHQYWYGMVGNDETREAWLDEGVTTFFQMELLDEYFKDEPTFWDAGFIRIDYWEITRMSYLFLLPVDQAAQNSWDFLNVTQYTENTYSKPALLLRSLENFIGKEKFYDFFKFYANQYRYQHPRGDDFIAAFNRFMEEDYSWAFDQFIKAGRGLDHSVYSVESIPVEDKTGTVRSGGTGRSGRTGGTVGGGGSPGQPDSKQKYFRNEAVFIRSDGYFPAELLIKLENGKSITSTWPGKEKWKRIVFIDESPIDYAAIDPGCKILLDKNFIDNTKKRLPQSSGIMKLVMKLGFLFQDVIAFLVF